MDAILNFKENSEKIIQSLEDDLKSIRTGRANPSLIENLTIETYGGQSKLRLFELAAITTGDTTSLLISPFDPSTITDIEKAILKSPLGISPQTQGNKIILRLPSLTTEQREKLIKLLNQKIEEKKVLIRNARDEARKKIKNRFETKEITEDDRYRQEKEIDSYTQNFMKKIQSIKQSKEEEIIKI